MYILFNSFPLDVVCFFCLKKSILKGEKNSLFDTILTEVVESGRHVRFRF